MSLSMRAARHMRLTFRPLLWAAILGLAACSDQPARVTLSMLASDPGQFDGRVVTTQGVVQHFDDPLHYWLEDPDVNRVELEPGDVVADYLDQEVLVTGRFSYGVREGRRLRVQEIEAVGETTNADTGNH